jgi:hypothetical protein
MIKETGSGGMTDYPRCISPCECPGRTATIKNHSKGKLMLEFNCAAYEEQNGYIIRDCEGVEIL